MLSARGATYLAVARINKNSAHAPNDVFSNRSATPFVRIPSGRGRHTTNWRPSTITNQHQGFCASLFHASHCVRRASVRRLCAFLSTLVLLAKRNRTLDEGRWKRSGGFVAVTDRPLQLQESLYSAILIIWSFVSAGHPQIFNYQNGNSLLVSRLFLDPIGAPSSHFPSGCPQR